jgi:hypothetical protein
MTLGRRAIAEGVSHSRFGLFCCLLFVFIFALRTVAATARGIFFVDLVATCASLIIERVTAASARAGCTDFGARRWLAG